VFSSNKVSLAQPYDQPLMDYIPRAKELARTRLNCSGIYSKVGIGPKGLECCKMFFKDGTEAEDVPFWGQKSNASYAAVNMLMRFYSTYDAEYAKAYVLPYLQEVADFWIDYLKYEDGRYVIYNDCIHENDPDICYVVGLEPGSIQDYRDDFNPILSLGLIRMVMQGLLDVTEYLEIPSPKREKWEHILTHLSAYPTQIRDGKKVFRYTERGRDWNQGGSLGVQHIYPGGRIGLSSEPELLQIA